MDRRTTLAGRAAGGRSSWLMRTQAVSALSAGRSVLPSRPSVRWARPRWWACSNTSAAGRGIPSASSAANRPNSGGQPADWSRSAAHQLQSRKAEPGALALDRGEDREKQRARIAVLGPEPDPERLAALSSECIGEPLRKQIAGRRREQREAARRRPIERPVRRGGIRLPGSRRLRDERHRPPSRSPCRPASSSVRPGQLEHRDPVTLHARPGGNVNHLTGICHPAVLVERALGEREDRQVSTEDVPPIGYVAG